MLSCPHFLGGISGEETHADNRLKVDDELKYQSVTDHLADLNKRFSQAEEALKDAVDIVENRLMVRLGY